MVAGLYIARTDRLCTHFGSAATEWIPYAYLGNALSDAGQISGGNSASAVMSNSTSTLSALSAAGYAAPPILSTNIPIVDNLNPNSVASSMLAANNSYLLSVFVPQYNICSGGFDTIASVEQEFITAIYNRAIKVYLYKIAYLSMFSYFFVVC